MKLQQLRFLCAVVQDGFNLSRAATTLGTSQPAISKQLQLLERELAVDLLVRRGNRILGLTAAGEAVIESARRTLWEADNLRRITSEFTQESGGRLVIASTHTFTRYVLRPVIKAFMTAHPQVQLVLRQGMPSMVVEWIATGAADLGIAGRPKEMHDPLILLPYKALDRSLFMPKGHPLLKERTLTVRKIARYPIITLDTSTEGGLTVIRTFEKAGCKPNVVLSAIDADVVKAYVAMGLGVAVLLSVSYQQDRDLDVANVSRLFQPTVPNILLREGQHISRALYDFIRILAPQWTRSAIEQEIRGSRGRRAAQPNARIEPS